jgi:hypothetical protein
MQGREIPLGDGESSKNNERLKQEIRLEGVCNVKCQFFLLN